MKILLMQPWISYRGAETISVQQAYYLQKQGHTTAIAAIFVDWKRLPQHGEEIAYLLPPKLVSALCQKSRLSLFLLGPLLLFFIFLKHRNDFEIFNAHNLPTVWIAALVGKLYKKKIVWTAHTVPQKVSWNKKKSMFEYFVWLFGASIFDKWAVSQVDTIIAVSQSVKEQVKKRYQKKAIVLYAGIRDVEGKNSDIANEIFQLRKRSKLLLLSVGALHPQKRQKLLLEVLRKFHSTEPTAAIIFVGDGPDRDMLKEYVAKHHLDQFVCFAGFVPQAKLAAYYKLCDLHVMPSVGESFGGATLEALSFGKLSIISEDNGAKEVLQEYILTCKSTVSSFLQQVKNFNQRRVYFTKKGKKGRLYIRKTLNWEKYVKDFTTLIQDAKEVASTVYNKGYYEIHYEKEHKALQQERETRLLRAIQLLGVKPGMKVLDLGCGNGELCLRLAEMGADVYGIDYSAEGIVLAKKRLALSSKQLQKKIHYYQMDAKKLEFADNFFDRVVSLDVFEHIYPEPLQKVIEEMIRVSKQKGKLVIETAPNLFFLGPVSFVAKKVLGWKKFESDEYHINVYDYFRFKKTLHTIPGTVVVNVLNDSHQYFSSRLWGVKNMPSWVKLLARIVDFLHENPVSEKIILNSPLKIFLAHDLWGVVTVHKKTK